MHAIKFKYETHLSCQYKCLCLAREVKEWPPLYHCDTSLETTKLSRPASTFPFSANNAKNSTSTSAPSVTKLCKATATEDKSADDTSPSTSTSYQTKRIERDRKRKVKMLNREINDLSARNLKLEEEIESKLLPTNLKL